MRTQAASLVAAFLFALFTAAQAATVTITPVPVGGTVSAQAKPVGSTTKRVDPRATAAITGVLLATAPSMR